MGVADTRTDVPRERGDATSLTSFVLVAGVTLIIVAFIILTTAPFTALLGFSSHTPIAVFHGLVATVMFVIAPIGLYLAYQLFRGRLTDLRTLKLYSVAIAVITSVTIAFGNWTLIGYRAEGGAREYLRANNPDVHAIFFEFKEYLALFTLPLAVVTAYLLFRYEARLMEDRPLRATISVLVVLTFLYFAGTFVLGASIARVRAV